MRSLSLAFCVTFAATQAAASMGPIPGEERFKALQGGDSNSAGAELAFSAIEEDFFLNITPRLDLSLGPVGLGLQVPLNLRIVDRDPENSGDLGGIIRKEDWDEPSDYLRALRYVRYGQKRDFIYARVGELAAEIGHGTILSRYMNNLDIDTFRLGTQFDLNTDYGGFETIISDVANIGGGSPDSALLGGRLYIKPVAFADPESVFNIFAIGFTLISDTNAPLTLAQGQNGEAVVDDDGNLVVATTDSQTVMGFDAEAEVLNTDILTIVPYADFNFIGDAGWGMHLGVLNTFKLPIGLDLQVPVRLEYRRFASNYVPIYFSTFYEVERYTFPPGTGVAPKAGAIRAIPDGDGINGFYGDLAFDFAGVLQLGFIYEDYEGAQPNFAGFLSVPALEVFQFKAYYARAQVQDFADAFKLDERSLAVAEGRYEVMPYLYFVGRWTRRWTLETDNTNADFGEFTPEDSWKVGLETSFSF